MNKEEREKHITEIEDGIILLMKRKVKDYIEEEDIKKVPNSFLTSVVKNIENLRRATEPIGIDTSKNITITLPKDWANVSQWYKRYFQPKLKHTVNTYYYNR